MTYRFKLQSWTDDEAFFVNQDDILYAFSLFLLFLADNDIGLIDLIDNTMLIDIVDD